MRRFGVAQTAVILAYVGTVIVNYLAISLPIGGLTTREVSDLYPALFVPAPYVFSIWSVIYLGLGIYAVAQAVSPLVGNQRVRSIAWWFALSGVLNSVWLVLWQLLAIYWTVPVMLALLATLLVIYLRLDDGAPRGAAERWMVRLPFSIYLGWISVATIANISGALLHAGWSGWGIADVTWTVLLLAIATLLGVLMLARRGDLAYAMVLVWAFVGIAVEQRAEPVVSAAALTAAAVTALALLATAWRLLSVGGRRRQTAA